MHTPTDTLAAAIHHWLTQKYHHSQSAATERTYRRVLTRFRATLHVAGTDLDGDPQTVFTIASEWLDQGEPSAATYNHRRTILQSFYAHAVALHVLPAAPPLHELTARRAQSYAHVRALTSAEAQAAPSNGKWRMENAQWCRPFPVSSCNRQRSSFMLHFPLCILHSFTGRRVGEIAALRWRDVCLRDSRVIVTFTHTKGGTTMADQLPSHSATALLDWLQAFYGPLTHIPATAPLWVSLSANRTTKWKVENGECTMKQTLRVVSPRNHQRSSILHFPFCILHLGGRYLAALRRDENPFAETLDQQLGGRTNG